MPVDSESPTRNPVDFEEPEENTDTGYTDFLPEAPQSPAGTPKTELPEYAAGHGSYGGMFNLIK